jgi:ATP-dependent DNA helicase RecQ
LLVRHVDIPRDLTLTLEFEQTGGDDAAETADGWDDFAAASGSGDWEPTALAHATGIALPQLEETLLRFQDAGHLTYRAAPRELLLELLPPPADAKDRMAATLTRRARAAEEHAGAMTEYARERRCRHGQIARYFGDRWPNLKCGMCDVCLPSGSTARSSTTSERSPQSQSEARGGTPAAAVEPAIAALQMVHDLAQGYRPFGLGKPGLARALRGTPDAPIKEGRASTFGALADMRKSEVERLIDALIERDYLRRDEEDEYRRLALTATGQEALSSGEAADLGWRIPKVAAAVAGKTSPSTDTVNRDADDLELLEALKAWRRETALADNVPPYVVFADKVLLGIAARRPANDFDLLEISGIGPAKAAKYGAIVLDLVARYPR